MNPEDQNEPIFAEVPEDLASLSDQDLALLIDDYTETRAEVVASPQSFITADLSVDALLELTATAVNDTLPALRAEQARRAEAAVTPEIAAQFADLATDAEPEPEPTAAAELEPEPEPEPEAVTASIQTRRRPRPPAAHEMRDHEGRDPDAVSLVAAAGAPERIPGSEFTSDVDLAFAMVERHRMFGDSPQTAVEKFVIARADWKDVYPVDRVLSGMDEITNMATISPVINPVAIKQALRERVHSDESMVASGGLCAPVTPYYNLQYISVPTRPVMASLPSFMADRGGLRYARPAALSAVTTAVGLITEAEDAAGGTSATKSCQVIPCPDFQETDVDIIYHCLQFGNLGARAFPELVAQWNNLVLAAHARLAESNLLTQIDAFSTQVHAGSLGLGASASLFSQILAAANGLRSRNRMDPEAVLRLMMPDWAIDLIVSDVIRTQFERFDTDEARVVALLRSFDIEPTFYIDSANGRGQVFGTQADGPLDAFPATVVWYLFPEGSFLYLDGGMLELGIVRDSILNSTNDFQIFGETFENVAYVGVESLAVESTVCDSGTVSLPAAVDCPITYYPPSY